MNNSKTKPREKFLIDWAVEIVHRWNPDENCWHYFGSFEGLQISHGDSLDQAVAKCEKAAAYSKRLALASKGNQMKKKIKRHCSQCGALGHDRRNCPHLKDQPAKKRLAKPKTEKPKPVESEPKPPWEISGPQLIRSLVGNLNQALGQVEHFGLSPVAVPKLSVSETGEVFLTSDVKIRGTNALAVVQYILNENEEN